MNLSPTRAQLVQSPDQGGLLLTVVAGVLLAVVLAWSMMATRGAGYVYDASGRRIPGPFNPWPFGYVWDLKLERDRGTFWRKVLELAKEYGDVFAIRVFRSHTVIVSDPAVARVVLTGSVHDFPKATLYDNLGLLPGGLITAKGEEWKTDRRLLHNVFSHDAVEGMLPIFNRHVKELINLLLRKGMEDMSAAFVRLTLDAIIHTSFGTPSNCVLNGTSDEMAAAAMAAMEEVGRRVVDPIPLLKYLPHRYLKTRSVIHTLTAAVKSVADDRRLGKRKDKATLMDLMLKATEGGKWSTEKLLAQSMTFVLAGHETTASMLCWTLLELCKNPRVLSKLEEEVDEVLGDSPSGDVRADHLERMTYLRCVMKESLRMHPPVTIMSRRTVKDLKLGGYDIPARWNVAVCILALHMNASVWDRPHEFQPERWEVQTEVTRAGAAVSGAGECDGGSGGAVCRDSSGDKPASSPIARSPNPTMHTNGADKPTNTAPNKTRHTRQPSVSALKDPFAYLPFSMGVRNCIGYSFALQECGVILARLIHDLKFELTEDVDKLEYVESVTVRPSRLRCRIKPRMEFPESPW